MANLVGDLKMAENSRYSNTPIRTNDEDIYQELLDKRSVKKIKQYLSPSMPSPSKVISKPHTTEIKHVWKTGDRFFKLAYKHYGDAELWWLIAWYNEKPTESEVLLGDVILIPIPLSMVLSAYHGGS